MENMWTVLISGLLAIATPFILAWQMNKNRAAEKVADYARQDAVADRVAIVAKKAEESAKLLAEVATTTKETHVLVNSNFTEVVRTKEIALTGQLAGMLEIVEMKKATGTNPSDEVLAQIAITRSELAETRAQLADRRKAAEQTEVVK